MAVGRGVAVEKTYADQAESLASTIREFRRRENLTLQELSRRCGIAASTISKIENGQLSPGYETLLRLSDGLRMEVSELFSSRPSGGAAGRRSITRKGEGVVHRSAHYEYEMLSAELSRKHFVPLVTRIRARSIAEFTALPRHDGEEFIYVLEGVVELHTEHYEPTRLEVGDSCYLDSTMGHALVALGKNDAVVLWVTSRLDGYPPPAAINRENGTARGRS
jgi:transcriptional regulator with XRE-family HTH domain